MIACPHWWRQHNALSLDATLTDVTFVTGGRLVDKVVNECQHITGGDPPQVLLVIEVPT